MSLELMASIQWHFLLFRGEPCLVPTIGVGSEIDLRIQTGWLVPCHSCTVRTASVQLLHYECISYSKFQLNCEVVTGSFPTTIFMQLLNWAHSIGPSWSPLSRVVVVVVVDIDAQAACDSGDSSDTW